MPATIDVRTDAPSPPTRRLALGLAVLVGLTAFFVLITGNSGGYRFGVSDQAFYIPAIHRALVPDAFPRDAALLAPQSSLLLWDQVMAGLTRLTGWRLEVLLFATYALAVLIMAIGVLTLSTSLYKERLTGWALLAALTLRHRVTKTGVNTFEGYFHPRVLAFALGLLAVGMMISHRRTAAIGLVAAAFVVHPTTALWFALWVAVALAIDTGRWRDLAVVGAAGVCTLVALVAFGPLARALTIMDPAWTDVLAEKDYLFPTAWSWDSWLINAIAPVVLFTGYRAWSRVPSSSAASVRAAVLGCLALCGVFLVSLPFIAARVALAVQLQTSRVLWPVELMATAFLIWWLAEAPWGRTSASPRTRALAVLLFFTSVSAARAGYVLRFEHLRPLVALELAESPWQRVTAWATQHTPRDAHFLVDPGHAWKFDSSFRVAARRDVLLEGVKDAAMATYSREVAQRVTERAAAIGDFETLTEQRALALSKRFALDYLITDRPLALPRVHAEPPFVVYALSDAARARAPSPDEPQ